MGDPQRRLRGKHNFHVSRGAAGRGKVTVDSYTKEMENFASDNISSLDTWVFDKVMPCLTMLLDGVEFRFCRWRTFSSLRWMTPTCSSS